MLKPTLVALVALTAAAGVVHAKGPDGHGRERMSFETFDTDGDGRITQVEIDALREARFAGLDTDGDNQVSRDEFMAHAAQQAAERAGGMFDRLDADGDGFLSRDMAEQRGPGRELIARLDTDGDGVVTEAEFDAMRDRMAHRMEGRGDENGRHGGGFFGKHRN